MTANTMSPRKRSERRAGVLLCPLVLALAISPALSPATAEAQDAPPATVRVTVDTAGPSTRVVLTVSRPVAPVVTATRGKIEVVYGEPVEVRPAEGKVEDSILSSFGVRGDRTVVLTMGPAYRRHETFELKNPTRLVVDLQGDRPTGAATGGARSESRPPFIVVIDPGHGGTETGAVGPSGRQEKDVVLEIARRLKSVLQEDPSVGVVLTRDEDRFVPLDERTAIANHNRADLFLSIHLNSSRRRNAYGAETYFLSPDATDDEARRLAALENRAPAASDPSEPPPPGGAKDSGLELVLWDLAQNQYLTESGRLAESVQAELNSLAGTRDRGVRQAPFSVLMGATMPAILIEAGFLSNPEEEARLDSPEHRERVVGAIASAVQGFRRGLTRLAGPGAASAPEAGNP